MVIMSRNNDEIITIGGGDDVDEMEKLVNRLQSAGQVLENIPVIPDETQEDDDSDEPIEIIFGGDDSDEEEIDEDEADDADESDNDASDEDTDADTDEAPNDSDEIIFGGDDSDEDEIDEDEADDADESDNDVSDEDTDTDTDESPNDSDEIIFGGDDSDEDEIDEDEADDADESDNDASDEDTDTDTDESPNDSDEIIFGGDDSDEEEVEVVIGGTSESENKQDSDVEPSVSESAEHKNSDSEQSDEVILLGGEQPDTEPPAENAESSKDSKDKKDEKKKPQDKKNERKSSGKKNSGERSDVKLPVPLIGPRDLEKVRAAKAKKATKGDDASMCTDEPDFRKEFLVSASPHLHCGETSRIIMQDVIIALLPAAIMSVIFFGWRAALTIIVCVLSCVGTEYICRRIMKRNQTISDCSAAVTGLLLAFSLPSTINPLFAVAGSVVAIGVVKQMFGGLGHNFANPAVTARIVLMLSFPVAMNTFPSPFSWSGTLSTDAVTTATPLAAEKGIYSLSNLLLGVYRGCLGETCAVALLLGGAYLLLRGVITWHIPLSFIGTTAVFALILGEDPFYHILSGGLLLGALFMATDYVTSPINKRGQIVFGIGCGLLTMLIRQFGGMPEGVSFAILLMNILTPHIERLTTPRPFGEEVKKA